MTAKVRISRTWATLDAFVEGGAVLGRRVANTTFLRALLQADPYDSYHFYSADDAGAALQRSYLADAFPALEARGAFHTSSRLDLPERLATSHYHCFHLSDPVTHAASLMALRNAAAANIFPVTSLTHSLSYVRFMAGFMKLIWPGVCRRDALVVTSQSARLVMERLFDSLRRGYCLDEAAFPSPELALIPLGVDGGALPGEDERPDGAKGRAAADLRKRLGVGKRVMILSLARFSPADKMDCLPLFAALRRAEALGLARDGYVLALAGWAEEGDALPEALAAYARETGIETRLLLRPTDAERRALYAAADIFVSPSDNIQETFGLTVAEAQAAGLPVVASDFDGYRDIVADGESGLLVTTLGFAQSALSEARSLFWYDNQYLLGLSQQSAVSVPELAAALHRLCTDGALRRAMGRAARKRAGRLFLWPAVIERLCALWDNLAARALPPEHERLLRGSGHPQTMRFAEFFRGHFSAVADDAYWAGIRLRRTASGEALYRGALPAYPYAGMDKLLDEALLRRALLASRKGVAGGELLRQLEDAALQDALPPALAREKAAFVLLWALKHDYLETE